MADSFLNGKFDFEIDGFSHDSFDLRFNLVHFFFWYGKDEFVMDLKNHLGLISSLAKEVIDLDHRVLDEVSGSPLDWSVESRSLSGLPHHIGRVIDVAEISLSSEHRLNISFGLAFLDDGIEVFSDLRIGKIEGTDDFRGFFVTTADLLGKSKDSGSIDDREVDRFRTPSHERGDFFGMEYPLRGLSMDIVPFFEDVDICLASRKGSKDS